MLHFVSEIVAASRENIMNYEWLIIIQSILTMKLCGVQLLHANIW